jgi:methenyltetrahydromethanopterin cyclohydrolase
MPDDMLSYGSVVHVYIMPSGKEDLKKLAERMPSQTAKCYGRSFTELTKEHGGLRGIDIELFAPAEVYVNNLETGELYRSGKVNTRLVKTMMGLKKTRK